MARKDSENQKKSMSKLFRGRAIFKPLNTGRIDERVACVREWIANIFLYTKNGVTIMIDAGYNYERLKEKMGWLDIDPASIQHILITHQDTDHVGAVEIEVGGIADNPAFRGYQVLLVDGLLPADKGLHGLRLRARAPPWSRCVRPGQGTFNSIFIVQGEHLVQVLILPGISPAQEGITVPQDAVIL